MRIFVVLVLLGTVGYFGYNWFYASTPEPAAPDPDADPQLTAMQVDGDETAIPTPPPSEEGRLRGQLEDAEGAEQDPTRIQLAKLLYGKGDTTADSEADSLLRQVYRGGGGLGPQAAAILLRRATARQDGTGLEYARFLLAKGPEAPGYARSCLEIARAKRQINEDSAQVEAWELMSKAYFAFDDPEWRTQVRPDVTALVQDLILSPRRTKACETYAVQPGDSLAKIAKQFGTTVTAIRWLNNLKGDVIHPRQTFKILKGKLRVEVDKSDFRLDVLVDDKFLYSTDVGLGRHGKTPLGKFVIEICQKHPTWYPPGQPEVPHGDPDNPLGDYWLGFYDTDLHSGYGIHGTDDVNSIGHESSDGCIRLRNEEVEILYRLLPPGTEVIVRE